MNRNKTYKINELILIIIIVLNFGCLKTYCQTKISIVNKDKKITIKNGNVIGLTTLTDTIKYLDKKELSYKLFKINNDSIVLRKPSIYRDSIINCNNNYVELQKLKIDYLYVGDFKKSESTFCKILIIEKYEYKKILNTEITSIQFPPKADEPNIPCFGCILVPFLNIYYISNSKKHWKPRNYKMEKWKLGVE